MIVRNVYYTGLGLKCIYSIPKWQMFWSDLNKPAKKLLYLISYTPLNHTLYLISINQEIQKKKISKNNIHERIKLSMYMAESLTLL